MEDLVEYQKQRIKALEDRNNQLRSWVKELTGNDYPSAYKRVIRAELLKQ
jgi:cell division protein FtsB